MSLTHIGRYQIIEELGRGAMGVVYRAFDPTIGRPVAIKTVLLDKEDPELIQRFRREAQAAGTLSYPSIVTIYDAGEDSGIFYIAMELVEGETLQSILVRGALPVDQAISVTEQVGAALDHAHARQIVHRDIKPANIMITPAQVKVMDFGVAKMAGAGLTATGQVFGTPAYMSPEMVKGAAVDGRTDIFALGAVLYEMLTNRRPFWGDNLTALIYKILTEDPAPPTAVNPSLHPGLNYVVFKSLAKDPGERYQRCAELAADLRNYRALAEKGKLGGHAAAPGLAAPAPTPPGTMRLEREAVGAQAARAGTTVSQFLNRRKSQVALASAAVLAVALILLWPRGQAPEPSLPSPTAPEVTAESPPAAGTQTPPTAIPPSQSTTEGLPGRRPPTSQGASPAKPPNSRAASPRSAARPSQGTVPPSRQTPSGVQGSPGRVVIHTEPQGASILVNGEPTPYRSPVNFSLPPGRHQITIERRGYASEMREIVVRTNQMVELKVDLVPDGSGGRRIPFLP